MALPVLTDETLRRAELGAPNGPVGGATVAISNKASGGAIGTAAATVDVGYYFPVTQTTASQTLTIPDPTNATANREIVIQNVGTQSFTMLGQTVAANGVIKAFWDGTAWRYIG